MIWILFVYMILSFLLFAELSVDARDFADYVLLSILSILWPVHFILLATSWIERMLFRD